MGKTLIIAEKPSVAKDIARVLKVPGSSGCYENDTIVVSNCIGHLVEIFSPLAESRDTPLPIIPDEFELRAIKKTADQFRAVKDLMRRKDIDTIANACDAGREGEAIFRLTYELAGCKKPTERLWLQSMTADAILTAWKTRKPGSHYDNLGDASRCRAEADWLVGINGSRACFKAVGRVMTPTLALIVRRFLANKNFVPKDYYEVVGTFGAKAGEYLGRWHSGVVQGNDTDAEHGYRLNDKAKADALAEKCTGVAPSSVTDDAKPTRSAPPLLFDLTSLQREANRKLKFSAAKTLTIAQSLYEQHKATSYPRTDACALPEDYVPKAKGIVGDLAAVTAYKAHSARIEENGWVKPHRRIFDNAKISDHFAIIPTGTIPTNLTPDESAIYDMVCRRFLAIFHPDAEYMSTARTTIVAGETFRSSGRVLTSPGWLEVYGGEVADDDKDKAGALVKVVPGEPVRNVKIAVKAQKTKPPALYTEATLLTAMETAGKALDDEEIAEAMKERGLGTPATRAATIEKLLAAGKTKSGGRIEPYMTREKNYLVPTQRGLDLIAYLDKTVPKLTSSALTGEWEHRLRQMEKGKVVRADFMQGIASFVIETVDAIRASEPPGGRGPAGPKEALDTPCPKCDGALQSDARTVTCTGCDFRLWREVAGRALSDAEVVTLLTEKETSPLTGFTSRSGGKFNAGLKLVDDLSGKLEFIFTEGQPRPSGEPMGCKCPKCEAPMEAKPKLYACSACEFKIWKTIAGRKISKNEAITLATKKMLPKMDGFVGKSGQRLFSAGLKLSQDCSAVEFVFDPR